MSWYHWIAEIFQKPSDRAQFIAILISSIVAVSVVLLNQHFNRKNARRSLNIEKTERFYQSILAFRNSAQMYLGKLYTADPGTSELMRLSNLTSDHIRDAEVFAHLYFQEISLDSSKIIKKLIRKQNHVISLPPEARPLLGHDELEKNIEEINEIYESLAEHCKNKIKEHKH